MTEPFETRIQALAKEFKYPPTPPIADVVMDRLRISVPRPRLSRKFAWALIIIIFLFVGLMFVPPVRAAVLEFIRIGIVRIFPPPVEPQDPTNQIPLTAMPASTPSSLIPILEEMTGEMTLEQARDIVDFPIPLPTYPPDLGEPNRVYLQNAGGWMLILVWLDPQQPDQVEMSLHLIEAGSWSIEKYHPTVIEETTVNGQLAIWTSGPYPLMLTNGNVDFTRLIDGHVLIWEENEITYRLETDLTLEEAVRIAESLTP